MLPFNRHRILVLQDKVSRVRCTTMQIYIVILNCALLSDHLDSYFKTGIDPQIHARTKDFFYCITDIKYLTVGSI